jgi:beta-lactamase regulating signal transducer with metallopeptidase domain
MRFRLWLVFFLAVFLQWVSLAAGLARHSLIAATSASSQLLAGNGQGHAVFVAQPWELRTATILSAFAVCYVVVLCGLLLRGLWGGFRLRKALKFRRAPSERLLSAFREIGLVTPSRNCNLWVLPGLESPATFGWLQPKIIVPSECESESSSNLQAVFWHELTHVQRRDALWSWLIRVCRNVLWFHPCVHYAFSAVIAERELACDEVVLENYPVARDSYAACLLHFARSGGSPVASSPCVELSSGTALLNLRVRSILREAPRESSASVLRRTMMGLAILSAMPVLAPGLRVLLTTSPVAIAVTRFAVPSNREGIRPAKGLSRRGRRAVVVGALPGRVGTDAKMAATPVTRKMDLQLAAAHRVGMNVVTEYGSSQNVEDRERALEREGPAPFAHHGTTTEPAWGSIVLGAVEHLGSVGMDRDHDRH